MDNPEIAEITRRDDGTIVQTIHFISSHRYQDLVAARVRIRERLNGSSPEVACAICGTPVYIVSSTKKRFFFRHNTEDGSCSAKTRGRLTQDEIRARKYHGLRESDAHLRIKDLIDRSLNADPVFREVTQEKFWRSATNRKARRRPDVQAVSPIGRLAIEVQLSTTFLDVVVGRRLFYRNEGASLIWVFGHFSPDYRRLTTDDLLFSNNSNVFVIDKETAERSEAEHAFHLRCFYRRPVRDGDRLLDDWVEQLIRFDQLICEQDQQRVFYFDYDAAAKALHLEIEADKAERRNQADDRLRKVLSLLG